MRGKLKLSQQAFLLVGIPLTFQVLFVAILAWTTYCADVEAQQELKSKVILDSADRVAYLAEEAGFTMLKYSRDRENLELRDKYFKVISEMRAQVASLRDLTKDDPEASRLVAEADMYTKKEADIANFVIVAMRNHEHHLENQPLSPLKYEIFAVSQNLLATCHKLAEHGERESQANSQHHYRGVVLPLLGAGVVSNILIALWMASRFNADITRRFGILSSNALKFGAGQTLEEPLLGDDEIAQLDSRFHRMAAALSDAARKERAIIENAIDVICSIDEKYCFLSASKSASEVFGWSGEHMAGTKLANLFEPAEFKKVLLDFDRVRVGESAPYFENAIKRRDGTRADLRWSVQWSPEDKVFSCIASDISARRELERVRHEFVSMMSHDLRTPLMSIQASMTLLLAGVSGELSEGVKRNLTAAERNINYIISLINSLIDVERLESGLIAVNIGVVELADVVGAALDAVQGLAHNKDIELRNEVDKVEIPGDNDRLLQVLINIISNALKFSPRNSAITVSTTLGANTVELQITDQGRGIPADKLDSVFDRFKQVYKTDAQVNHGSGLGLAICKSIIEAHGGTIGVRSIEGQGSTFWFKLPLQTKVASAV